MKPYIIKTWFQFNLHGSRHVSYVILTLLAEDVKHAELLTKKHIESLDYSGVKILGLNTKEVTSNIESVHSQVSRTCD